MATLKERLAALETENDAAKPLHVQFGKDIVDLKDRTARIETKVDRLLENGSQKPVALMDKAKAVGTPLISGGGFVAILMLLLDRL